MIPITLNRSNILQWIYFGLLEAWRVLVAVVTGRGFRVNDVARHVERHTTAGDCDAILKSMDEFAQANRFLMNVGDEKGDILKDAMDKTQATRVLELGAYCGYSAVLMGKDLKTRGGTLVSLEVSKRNANATRRVVAHAGLSDVVDVQVGAASNLIPNLTEPFDLVFIDHWKDDYLPDLKRLEDNGLVKPGTCIVADNVGIFSKTLESYLEYVRTAAYLESTHYASKMEYNDSIEDGVEVSFYRALPA